MIFFEDLMKKNITQKIRSFWVLSQFRSFQYLTIKKLIFDSFIFSVVFGPIRLLKMIFFP